MYPFFRGFLVGLAVGAAVGLLMSPHKGVENRALARRQFEQAVAAGQKAAQEQDERLRARFRQQIGLGEGEEEPAQS